ncbi:hypothetical protein MKX01_018454 [Papaver californicum]|nr:hypothetical protein MKX01_018454 [Papaver californicum]
MTTGIALFDDIRTNREVAEAPQDDMVEINENVIPLQCLKPNVVVTSSVRELLECPVCLNAMYPPIHQCSNGHTLGSGCKPRVHNHCPTCRHELGNIRCLALEKVAASLDLPCKYQNFGCLGIYPYYSKLKHELQCAYRPYNCPYAGSECTVMGDIPFLVTHLRDDHKVDMHNGSTFNHRYVKSNPHEGLFSLLLFCARLDLLLQRLLLPLFMCFLFFVMDWRKSKLSLLVHIIKCMIRITSLSITYIGIFLVL